MPKSDPDPLEVRHRAFIRMDAVISTLIPRDPPAYTLRRLGDDELLGYSWALDGYLEEVQREWVRRKMEKENA